MDESVVKHFEQAQVGTIKLSAAIRIGAQMRPQAFSELFINGGSCALGAAYEGATGKTCSPLDYCEITRVFPTLGKDGMINPFALQITTRNDNGETREQIADWLESEGW